LEHSFELHRGLLSSICGRRTFHERNGWSGEAPALGLPFAEDRDVLRAAPGRATFAGQYIVPTAETIR
jgi:hypothetical protein